MRHFLRTLTLIAFTLSAGWIADGARAQETFWPTDGWRSSTPEEQGLDSAALADAVDYARQSGVRIHSLTLVRNGYLVLDAYFWPFENGQRHDLASVTKSVTTTLVGIGIGQGDFAGVSQSLPDLFPGQPIAGLDERKGRETLEHLLTMSSGLECNAASGEITLSQMRASRDWARFMRDLPMRDEPGSRFEYCSGGMHLLSGAISQATGMSALEFARRELFAPLGITNVAWPADAQGVSHGWGDLQLEPRDMARLGFLWLNQGRWENRQIVPRDWMEAAIEPRSQPPRRSQGYGYGFWIQKEREPIEYEATGRGGQRITVIPDRNLVIVMTGGEFEPGDIGAFIGRSLKSDQALPDNPSALARLNAAVAEAALPIPPATWVSPMAEVVSGKRYRLGPNPLNLTSLTLTFPAGRAPELELGIADRIDGPRPIGEEGVSRLSPSGYPGLPVALTGAWRGEDAYVLEYNEVGGINTYELRLRFSGDTVFVALSERSRVIQGSTFTGTATP